MVYININREICDSCITKRSHGDIHGDIFVRKSMCFKNVVTRIFLRFYTGCFEKKKNVFEPDEEQIQCAIAENI